MTVVLLNHFDGVGSLSIALAHQVELSKDIGGTLHIEPNDTPRAGEEVLAWVALTRAGGDTLSLTDCDCQMEIYTQPRQPGDSPVAAPSPTAVEGDSSAVIPGARFTFPEVGAYTLVMSGKPQDTVVGGEAPNTFTPFELAFDVTVAAGNGATPVAAEMEVAQANSERSDTAGGSQKVPGRAPRGVAVVAIATGILAGLLSLFLWGRRQKS